MTTARIEEYLESIFKLQQGKQPANATKVAEDLKLSAASVSEMLKKLENSKLIRYRNGKEILLTKKGNLAASQIVRRHRLWERFLTDLLGFKWDKVHEEACKLEHASSPEVAEKLARVLGNPKTCPHGNPIPDEKGFFTDEPTRPLSELKPEERGIIVKVTEEGSEVLRYLASLGLVPQTEIRVKEMAPFGGPLLIQAGNSKHALGREIASKILVKS